MIRRPPRSTLDRSSAASDVYKRQRDRTAKKWSLAEGREVLSYREGHAYLTSKAIFYPVSYTHLRAHETVLDIVCRLLLEKKKNNVATTENNTISQDKAAQYYRHNAT